MRKALFLYISAIFLFPLGVYATSGACSYHGGVNCSAGPSLYGNAQCSDGTLSSVSYYDMAECSAAKLPDPSLLCPAPIQYCDYDSLNRLEELKKNALQSCVVLNARIGYQAPCPQSFSFDADIASCKAQISNYEIGTVNYQSCRKEVETQIKNLLLPASQPSAIQVQRSKTQCSNGTVFSEKWDQCVTAKQRCVDTYNDERIDGSINDSTKEIKCFCRTGSYWDGTVNACLEGAPKVSLIEKLGLQTVPQPKLTEKPVEKPVTKVSSTSIVVTTTSPVVEPVSQSPPKTIRVEIDKPPLIERFFSFLKRLKFW